MTTTYWIKLLIIAVFFASMLLLFLAAPFAPFTVILFPAIVAFLYLMSDFAIGGSFTVSLTHKAHLYIVMKQKSKYLSSYWSLLGIANVAGIVKEGKMAQKELQGLIERADQAGLRLEIIGGLPVWEAYPAIKHQEAVDRIRATIKPSEPPLSGCGCFHYADIYIQFPDGSLKRPDVSIFCRRPEEEEHPVTLVPEAVIEVISKGSEAKDMELAPYFYLAQGVKDVVIFDPYTLFVLHARRNGRKHHTSPVAIEFECGCQCEV